MRPISSMGLTRAHVWREIADGVLVRRYPVFGVNSGLILGDGAALLIDTRSSDRQGRELAREVGWVTNDPIRIVNSHHHFDHSFGNSAFAESPIWGHERCAERLRDDAPTMRRALAAAMPEVAAEFEETKVVAPTKTFRDKTEIQLGNRIVRLYFFGRGHTDNDVVVEVPDVHAIFAGDLVEQAGPPSFEDSYPLDWPGTLGRMLDLPIEAVVPGHGDVVGREFVEGQLADISALASLARRVRFDGGSVSDGLPLSPFPESTSRDALRRAFAQLAGEL